MAGLVGPAPEKGAAALVSASHCALLQSKLSMFAIQRDFFWGLKQAGLWLPSLIKGCEHFPACVCILALTQVPHKHLHFKMRARLAKFWSPNLNFTAFSYLLIISWFVCFPREDITKDRTDLAAKEKKKKRRKALRSRIWKNLSNPSWHICCFRRKKSPGCTGALQLCVLGAWLYNMWSTIIL